MFETIFLTLSVTVGILVVSLNLVFVLTQRRALKILDHKISTIVGVVEKISDPENRKNRKRVV
jgi:hypothetical protein